MGYSRCLARVPARTRPSSSSSTRSVGVTSSSPRPPPFSQKRAVEGIRADIWPYTISLCPSVARMRQAVASFSRSDLLASKVDGGTHSCSFNGFPSRECPCMSASVDVTRGLQTITAPSVLSERDCSRPNESILACSNLKQLSAPTKHPDHPGWGTGELVLRNYDRKRSAVTKYRFLLQFSSFTFYIYRE